MIGNTSKSTFIIRIAAAAILAGGIDVSEAQRAKRPPRKAKPSTKTTPATISYDFPAVEGELFHHAFCVMDASSATVRSTMPQEFYYSIQRTPFNSNTRLFGDNDELTPAKRSIRETNQCRGGIYLQPSHEYYDEAHTELGDSGDDFSFDKSRFGLDVVPKPGKDGVTICALVPDRGELTGGWDKALRKQGFTQGKFQDSPNQMTWEVHCKAILAKDAADTKPSIAFPSVTRTQKQQDAKKATGTSSVEEQKEIRKQRIRLRNGLPAKSEEDKEPEEDAMKSAPAVKPEEAAKKSSPPAPAETTEDAKKPAPPAPAEKPENAKKPAPPATAPAEKPEDNKPEDDAKKPAPTAPTGEPKEEQKPKQPRLRTRNGLPLRPEHTAAAAYTIKGNQSPSSDDGKPSRAQLKFLF